MQRAQTSTNLQNFHMQATGSISKRLQSFNFSAFKTITILKTFRLWGTQNDYHPSKFSPAAGSKRLQSFKFSVYGVLKTITILQIFCGEFETITILQTFSLRRAQNEYNPSNFSPVASSKRLQSFKISVYGDP